MKLNIFHNFLKAMKTDPQNNQNWSKNNQILLKIIVPVNPTSVNFYVFFFWEIIGEDIIANPPVSRPK